MSLDVEEHPQFADWPALGTARDGARLSGKLVTRAPSPAPSLSVREGFEGLCCGAARPRPATVFLSDLMRLSSSATRR